MCKVNTRVVQVKEHVEEVMSIVELDKIRGALVGIPGATGLSVEQRKRLSIAVEMVANPSVIFMDEPTSGHRFPPRTYSCTHTSNNIHANESRNRI